jgi:hypothetical protein
MQKRNLDGKVKNRSETESLYTWSENTGGDVEMKDVKFMKIFSFELLGIVYMSNEI